MGKLKVGFVFDDTLDNPDGVQQYILCLGNWMQKQGHEVHYLVGQTLRGDIPNVHSLSRNIRVNFNGNRMSTPLPGSKRKIRELLQREQYDVLHVQIPYSPFLAQRIILAAPDSTAIIGTFHIAPNSNLVSIANHVLGKLITKSLKRFDAIVSVSEAAADFAKNTHKITSSILPNVVDVNFFKKADPYTIDPAILSIVFVGRLVPRKGCHILLEAVNILVNTKNIKHIKVTICGRGPLQDQLQAYVSEHKLANYVSFAGFVDENAKASYLRSADIAVYPSTGGESFGIVLTEAMAAHHPVVIGAANDGYKTVLGGNPDLLFATSDAESLSNKLEYFISDKKARDTALTWQATHVRQFDVNVVGPRLIARYREALRLR